jgi:peptide chain release factor 2
LEEDVETWNELESRFTDAEVMAELLEEDEDEETAKELRDEVEALTQELDKLELKLMLSGKHDRNSAILSIHPGAGGTESQDWASMLLRMYQRWAERKGYKVEMLDLLPGDEAGIKSATLLISGDYAYGYLKAESGVHRLVRISPFDANRRRHTSFASVSVIPEIEDEVDVEIKDEDLRIDTFRAGGPGGQHVNRTDSAVRIVHIPTGITVQCQTERSQHRNRELAMKVLKARLYEYYRQKQEEELAKLRGERKDIAFGNQIRSYVFHPYRMVKDLRTGVETGNVDAVMDGEIDMFIEAYLKENIGK